MATVEKRFLLQVPSSTRNLGMVREFIGSVGGQAGLGESAIAKLQLAVDEACANVIEHAYGHDATKEVMIRVSFDDAEMRFEVIDTGAGFDPDQIPRKEVEQLIAERRKGGLGLRLIRTLMDEVYYEIEPGRKNQLRMVKRLKPEETT